MSPPVYLKLLFRNSIISQTSSFFSSPRTLPTIITHNTNATNFNIFPKSINISKRTYTSTNINSDNDIIIEQLTEGEKYLYEKLSKKFSPTKLHVQDISGGCGSMYSIEISSNQFKGLPIIKQHRMVNELLQEDIKKMHGLQLKTSHS
ncbi:hypothetical protein Glove_303g102 [Diversispora epigaea]|uniref:Bola-like protein n=1 Tax=Diversispora epigaea TaxID=1348612 RepID=A0A397HW28_9GLOM|nr:hypothetical protein Glove_303g102 [Diversispora epigaea]